MGKDGGCIELKTLPPTRGADCLEISNSSKFQGLFKLFRDYFTYRAFYMHLQSSPL